MLGPMRTGDRLKVPFASPDRVRKEDRQNKVKQLGIMNYMQSRFFPGKCPAADVNKRKDPDGILHQG